MEAAARAMSYRGDKSDFLLSQGKDNNLHEYTFAQSLTVYADQTYDQIGSVLNVLQSDAHTACLQVG